MEEKIIVSTLDFLEVKESKLLGWGVTDGGFTEAELENFLADFLVDHFPHCNYSPYDVKEALLKKKLLFRFPSPKVHGEEVFRTRSAETLRMLNAIKQIIPLPHLRSKRFASTTKESPNWQHAPTLVADFRYMLRPRVFPKRIHGLDTILTRLQQLNYLAEGYRLILKTLLTTSAGEMTLADFQVDALVQMLGSLSSRHDKGMIITAGTGSGKTYGFYLPALMHIGESIEMTHSRVKAIALYPRKELLIDQFTNAYKLALKLNPLIRRTKFRSISLGAYFGATPTDEQYLFNASSKSAKDWQCSFIKCPDCDGDLFWLQTDIEKKRHVLTCKTCSHRTPQDDILRLTRQRMAASPPDILFTTTEMMNRLMSDSWSYHLVGIGIDFPPELVLLDEVHTYSGVHGAQVANLLRRWRKSIRKSVFFTGLSATLENAPTFFADLIGLLPNDVTEVSPIETEQRGMEYVVALRGDPVSGTALLSTTIQAIMLLRRSLEQKSSTERTYGKKVFAFADNLDVTNRLYHNLLDAEGYQQSSN